MRTARKHLTVVSKEHKPSCQEYENKYQTLFDHASDAIISVTPDGDVDALNFAAEDLTGFLKTELSGKNISSLSPDEKVNRIPERAKLFSMNLLNIPGTYEDVAIVRKDSYVRLVDISVRHVKSGSSYLALVLFRDVTEKKRMERELITKHGELRNAYIQLEKKNAELQTMQQTLVQAGKLTALGELAAGIAHELNQPLQGIRGYAQELNEIIKIDNQQKPEVFASLKEIISSVDKMAQIIGYLRSFTRKSTEKHERVDIHKTIEESLKMLSRQFIARGIKVEKSFENDLPHVYANPLQLEQVFINLATNARDAIEATGRGSGTVIIRTRRLDKFVEIYFYDDGCGMAERTKTKMFDPFFTTKEVGKGMGLGLSLSYGMITKIQGSIVVESEIGKGTSFTITLPTDFRELV